MTSATVDREEGAGAGGWLFWLFAFGVLVRGFVGASLLDRLDGYTSPGGSLLTKIAPGSYILLAAAAWALTRPKRSSAAALVRPAVALAAVALCGAVWATATGATASVGALFDLYLAAAAALFTLSRFDERDRTRFFHLLVLALGVNGAILLAEFAAGRRFVTQAFLESGAAFRPAAALDHPLLSGLIYAAAAPLLATLRAPLVLRLGAVGLAMVAVAISGARTATLVTLALSPLLVLAAIRATHCAAPTNRALQSLQLGLFAALAPLLAAVALSFGLARRFNGSLMDESALKRVRDFEMLSYLTPHQWLFGGAAGSLQDWSMRLFNGASVESPVVSAVFMFGAPAAAALFVLLMLALLDLARACDLPGRLSLLAFLVIAASNNTLVVKNPSLLFVAVMVATAGLSKREASVPHRETTATRRAQRRPARTRALPPSAA